jgi:hypothetical protein
VEPLLAELSRKYTGGGGIPMEAVTSGYLWLYELAPRGCEKLRGIPPHPESGAGFAWGLPALYHACADTRAE